MCEEWKVLQSRKLQTLDASKLSCSQTPLSAFKLSELTNQNPNFHDTLTTVASMFACLPPVFHCFVSLLVSLTL